VKLTGDRNQCTGCDAYFNSAHAFDKHRTGEHGKNRRCLAADEMAGRGMCLGADGFWRGSAMPGAVLALHAHYAVRRIDEYCRHRIGTLIRAALAAPTGAAPAPVIPPDEALILALMADADNYAQTAVECATTDRAGSERRELEANLRDAVGPTGAATGAAPTDTQRLDWLLANCSHFPLSHINRDWRVSRDAVDEAMTTWIGQP